MKGTAIASGERYVKERFGDETWLRILRDLSPEERGKVEGILVSAWYPFPLFLKVVRLVEKHLAGKEARPHHQMGRASAEYGLTTVYKVFVKVGAPQHTISKVASVWKTYYSSGEMKAVTSEEGHAALELSGFAEPARELCERLVGWLERMLELAGGREVKLVHSECVNRGDPVCRFEGWWT